MKILIISNNYPSRATPSRGVFVYNLIQQFAKLGHEITIISPESVGFWKPDHVGQDYGEELGRVYRPKFLSASAKRIGKFNTYCISELGQVNAVKRMVRRHKIEFDLVYAHFLVNAFVAVQALASYRKPIYAAVGESNIDQRKGLFHPHYFKKNISQINGFIAVSPLLKDKLISFGVPEDQIIVSPNAVDFGLFYKRNKLEMRRKHQLPLNKKLIIFVGRFLHHKGPMRILEAVDQLEDIGLIFVGNGDQILESDKIVFKDRVASEVVPELLSAADVFVLPTLQEGSCNAIVEAMACGLPIISSHIPEVKVQCDPSFSILVNPLDTDAIRSALKKMFDEDGKIDQMSKNALQYAKQFDIKERAKMILNFVAT